MNFPKRRLAIIGSSAAIALSVALLVSRWVRPSLDVKPNEAVGQVLAEEAVRVLGGQGQVVLVTLDPSLSAAVKIQTDAFLAALKKTPSVTLAATERLQRADVSGQDVQKEIPAARFLNVAQTYPQAAIVSLVGVPHLADSEIAKLPQPPPKLLAVVRSRKALRELLESGRIQVAIVPRFAFPAPVGKPRRVREWFDKYFQILTSASDLPPSTRSPIEGR